jgi:hypothetical protein
MQETKSEYFKAIKKLKQEMKQWNLPKSHQTEILELRKTRIF